MKIPKWHEVEPKHITVTWDMGKQGEKPCVAVFVEIDGKVYVSKYFDKDCGAINIGDIVCQITSELEKSQERLEMKKISKIG